MLADGQVHGGIAQGIGQALLEEAVYDENGQLISGSFIDYAIPKAETFPMFDLDNTVIPTPHNPMGAKGIGGMGTISATIGINLGIDVAFFKGIINILEQSP